MGSDPLNLHEAGEWAGLWWLRDEPDEQVPVAWSGFVDRVF